MCPHFIVSERALLRRRARNRRQPDTPLSFSRGAGFVRSDVTAAASVGPRWPPATGVNTSVNGSNKSRTEYRTSADTSPRARVEPRVCTPNAGGNYFKNWRRILAVCPLVLRYTALRTSRRPNAPGPLLTARPVAEARAILYSIEVKLMSRSYPRQCPPPSP